ncbi:prephenate dehydrogenase [Dethiosulfatibacter aminovorans DSM 17477]|uniref:Prephenate dehydrogenase n=1 Tax=Dethiosulfatibacter aminovorans DSM 17477 TaxID=1121476 RepID=A0A1M6IPS2_9FIRM|nr:prephenate dehydrogenase [Dethiosulfatibacter aminovorans]SHJ36450.1 prephenate dehydrogenase [Dethiosulfatibacter aminovorans DSM 17477]
MNFNDKNITIVGLGMEGGSFAIAIKEFIKPRNLFAVDIDENILIAAEKLGVISKGFKNPADILGKSDIVIMCIYPSLVIEFMKEHMEDFKSGCIVTDVAGVKRNIVNELDGIVRDDIDFIPGHPMAGNEFRGFLYADKKIFEGCSYLLTPTEQNKEENLVVIETLARKIGASIVFRTDIDTHDTMIAYASQLIHVIASSIVNSDYYSDDITLFSGGSFKSATRVANINPDLWTDAFLENKDNLIKQIDAFSSNIQKLKDALIEEDADLIHGFLKESFTRSNRHTNKFK